MEGAWRRREEEGSGRRREEGGGGRRREEEGGGRCSLAWVGRHFYIIGVAIPNETQYRHSIQTNF